MGMTGAPDRKGTETDLDDVELEALRDAVAVADAEVERGEFVEHEAVREWLLDLAQGKDRTMPRPARHSGRR